MFVRGLRDRCQEVLCVWIGKEASRRCFSLTSSLPRFNFGSLLLLGLGVASTMLSADLVAPGDDPFAAFDARPDAILLVHCRPYLVSRAMSLIDSCPTLSSRETPTCTSEVWRSLFPCRRSILSSKNVIAEVENEFARKPIKRPKRSRSTNHRADDLVKTNQRLEGHEVPQVRPAFPEAEGSRGHLHVLRLCALGR